ncbi:MAG TPA: type II toxin-antitoxin system HicB family antitoxin [Candidatus Baltobacteraceae bacterium]|nr:type II toxin-antitoxin system HicB family antitoxin [Candidatus Baltobacteraceae bacterium]
MKYAVVVEKLTKNYCAHVPDLPVCVTTGATLEETIENIRDAIAGYIDSCREHGDPIPPPTTRAIELEVA